MELGRERDGGSGRLLSSASVGLLRVALLFGSAGVALALILVPIADRRSRDRTFAAFDTPGIDLMSTGTVAPRGESYTIRRSVLQPDAASVCIIRDTGSRSGFC